MYSKLPLKITFILISLQIIHLSWLTVYIVLPLAGFYETPEQPPDWLLVIFVVIDYIEIPALIMGIIFYISLLADRSMSGKRLCYSNIVMISLLGIQFIHILWITDEVVYGVLINKSLVVWPIWLAWIAILIDYAEVPVIADLFKRIRNKRPTLTPS